MLAITLFSYIISYIVAIALPAYFSSFITSRIVKKVNYLQFASYVSIIGLIVTLVWQIIIPNTAYKHWDSYSLSFTYLFHEGPEAGNIQDMYLPGWSSQKLEFTWISTVIACYMTAGFIFIWKEKSKKTITFTLLSITMMLLLSFSFLPILYSSLK